MLCILQLHCRAGEQILTLCTKLREFGGGTLSTLQICQQLRISLHGQQTSCRRSVRCLVQGYCFAVLALPHKQQERIICKRSSHEVVQTMDIQKVCKQAHSRSHNARSCLSASLVRAESASAATWSAG